MAKKKKSFVVTETVFRGGTDIYRYYRDNSSEALDKVFFLYNDWREEVKLPSGRIPPKLSSRQVVRLTLDLAKNKKATLKSPKSWNRKFVWVVEKI
jgi:hypothetical protein